MKTNTSVQNPEHLILGVIAVMQTSLMGVLAAIGREGDTNNLAFRLFAIITLAIGLSYLLITDRRFHWRQPLFFVAALIAFMPTIGQIPLLVTLSFGILCVVLLLWRPTVTSRQEGPPLSPSTDG